MSLGRWRGGTSRVRWHDRCQQPGKSAPEVQDMKSYKFLGSYIHLHQTWETGHHKHADVQCFACHFCSLCHKKLLCPSCLLSEMFLLDFCLSPNSTFTTSVSPSHTTALAGPRHYSISPAAFPLSSLSHPSCCPSSLELSLLPFAYTITF